VGSRKFQVQSLLLSGFSALGGTRILRVPVLRGLFVHAYFLYKRYLEDPFFDLLNRNPELFGEGHVLDVGANIGYTAVLFSEFFTSHCIHAFEPEEANFAILSRRCRANRRIICNKIAVSDRSTTQFLQINPSHHADHKLTETPGEGAVPVATTTVDAYVEQHLQGEPIAFVKIDVQGHELQVLKGMSRTLRDHDKLVVCVEYSPSPTGDDASRIPDFMADLDFSCMRLGPKGELREVTDTSAILEPHEAYCDLVFARRTVP
jgi:FkbM family methyltransferase